MSPADPVREEHEDFDALSKVRESLVASERRFRLIVESVKDYAIFMLDPSGVVATWNTGAERIKGYTADEIIGQHFSRFYPESARRAGKPDWELEVAAQDGRLEDEGWRVRKDGSLFWANVVITALHDSNGNLVGFAKVTRDLTDRRNAEEARLRLAHESAAREAAEGTANLLARIQSVAGALSAARTPREVAEVLVSQGPESLKAASGIFVRPYNGNLELLASYGISRRSVEAWLVSSLDQPTLVGIAYRSAEAQWIEETKARERDQSRLPEPLEAPSLAALPLVVDGRVLGVLAFGFAEARTFAPEERTLLGAIAFQAAQVLERANAFAREVAARQQLESVQASLQRAQRNADIGNRAKDQFLAVVSHELRTPLNAIMGWAKLMSVPGFDETRRGRAVETIERNAMTMAKLIEDLLDMSRVISGKMRLDVQQVELGRIIEAAIESIRPAADAKGIGLFPVLDTPLRIMGDPTRLQQVVWNLMSNAVKFTPKGGHIDVLLRRSAPWIEISVADTGKGIAREFLPHVFDAFRQEDAGATRSHSGLGLGLAIARQLVELHGGSIEARSRGEGRGASFTVRLPIAAVEHPVSDEKSQRSLDQQFYVGCDRPPQLRDLRVLVVEDDQDARQLVKAILEDCGCRVTTARGVDEAMTALARDLPDLLVSDIGMPARDGYDLIRELREQPAGLGGDLPAVALTAYARAEDKRAMLNAGYSTCITKPVDPAELVAVLASLARLAQRRWG
jgi:PAS domain S-box-containing protein